MSKSVLEMTIIPDLDDLIWSNFDRLPGNQ